MTVNNVSALNTRPKFDPVEATRQLKDAIGIGQIKQQNVSSSLQPLIDLKPIVNDQQQQSNMISSKSTGHNLNTKLTSPPRIPHQPVIFSDHFDGGINKIDVQFGNLSEPFEETASSQNLSVPTTSLSSTFYSCSESITSATKQNSASTSVQTSQISAKTVQHPISEQSSFVSPTTHTNLTHLSEQQPVMNQQRILPQQIQSTSMTMKPIVSPQYAVHHQQHQINPANLLLHPLLFHQQQQKQQEVNI